MSVGVRNRARPDAVGIFGSTQAIRWKFDVIFECTGIYEDKMPLTLATNCRNNPIVVSYKQKKLRCRNICRRMKGIARIMLQSVSSALYKRAWRWFNGTVEGTGIHEAILSPTLVLNCRNNLVFTISPRKTSYAEINVGKCKESRACHAATGLRDSIQACTPEG